MNRTYTTKHGDMWDSIAFTHLGSVAHMDTLILCNQQYHDIYIFPAGVILALPDITEVTTKALPPWKQVLK